MNNIISQEEKNRIDAICKQYYISKYTINSDGSIDVDDEVYMWQLGLKKLPLIFGKVSGDFHCGNNNLTSLEHCPTEVGGYFYCGWNKLTSLEHCPNKIFGEFNCEGNHLDSLEGGPKEVGGDFLCSENILTSLEYSPNKVGGDFVCKFNRLTSLEHCPVEVGGDLKCMHNYLPKEIMGLDKLELGVFIKYQSYYDVWTPDLNMDGMNELVAEIKDGLM
jgi:hypothetical protein